MKLKKLSINSVILKNQIILAPMVEVTDSAYRQLCLQQGAALTFTQMLYTSQIINENPKTKALMHFEKKERPIGIQITGSNLSEFKACLPYLKPYDIIDINCGCPSNKLINSKAGSYLLKDPKKIAEIIKFLKKEFPKKAITAKIRLGFKKNNALKIAKAIESAGADAITVHGRLSNQKNSSPADWNEIKKIKSALSIPIIGNGDIFSGKDAEAMLRETGCDAIMIARGAIGDPMIFSRILNYLKDKKEIPKNQKENLKLFLKYIKISKTSGVQDLGRTKYLGIQFLKDFEGAPKARASFSKLSSLTEIEKFTKNVLKTIK